MESGVWREWEDLIRSLDREVDRLYEAEARLCAEMRRQLGDGQDEETGSSTGATPATLTRC